MEVLTGEKPKTSQSHGRDVGRFSSMKFGMDDGDGLLGDTSPKLIDFGWFW